MTVDDVVEYLEMNNEITFENICDLVEEWIEDTSMNYPEYIK